MNYKGVHVKGIKFWHSNYNKRKTVFVNKIEISTKIYSLHIQKPPLEPTGEANFRFKIIGID